MLAAMWHMLIMLAPWMLLGAAVAGALHVLVPPGLLSRHLQGPGGVLKAIAIGTPLPLCSCGVIPAGLGLKRDGAADGPAIGFLISTPQTGVDSMLVSAGLLGWPFAIFKVGAAVITGAIGGLGVHAFGGDPVPATDAASHDAEPDRSLRGGWVHALQIVRSIWGWLVFGIVASAAITVWVPPEAIAAVGLSGPWAMLGVLVIALPVYVCAVASVPLAAGLVAAGMPVGAALVFLMAGPATNLATIGAIAQAFGRRVLVIYLSVLIAGSLAAAWVFEWLLPGQTLTGPTHMEHTAWWEIASAIVLLALLAWFAFDDLRRRVRPAVEATIELPVEGLTCGGCVRRLEGVLGAVEGVSAVQVELSPGRAKVSGAVSVDAVRDAIEGAGFGVGATA